MPLFFTSTTAEGYNPYEFYLGPKAADPTVDNNGGALVEGQYYWNTALNIVRFYTGTVWADSNLTAVQKTGDIMTGQLTLPGGGTGNQAATVNQVNTAATAAATESVSITGDTMTGLLVLSGNATASLNPVPLQQVEAMTTDNRIINGDMAIDQINLGVTVTVPVINPQYIVDCWCVQSAHASKFQIGQSTSAPTGFRSSLSATSLSAYTPLTGDFFISHRQNIEGLLLRDSNFGTASARSIAVSFWVFSSLTGLHAVSFSNAAANRSYVATYTVIAANTWEYKTIIVPGDVTGTWAFDTTLGLGVAFDFGSGSTYDAASANVWNSTLRLRTAACVRHVATNGAVLRITGVQVLVSTVAMPIIQRLLIQEFRLCQRYFQRHTSPPLRGVFVSTTGISRFGMPLPVTMRVAPLAAAGGSLTFAGPALNIYDGASVGTINAFTVNYSSPTFIEFDCNVATGTFVAFRPAVAYFQDNGGAILLNAGI
jgi:hypothetical protein